MARYSYPDHPAITLYGVVNSSGSTGVDKYGVSDDTGLGPNGADVYRTYSATIENIQAQSVGDNSVRSGKGLGVGGQYTGFDLAEGDFISNQDGTRIFQIIDVTRKRDNTIDIVYEDVWMGIAKSRADRINFFNSGDPVIFFSGNDENVPLLSWNGSQYFTDEKAIDRLQAYFSVYQPSHHFTFYPATGADLLSPGDLVTSTGGTGEYSLIKVSSGDDVIVGQVSEVFGNGNVIVKTRGRVITKFDSPGRITGGEIGDIWYSDESGGYNTSSTNNEAIFFQISNAEETSVTGTTANPTFDQTLYSLSINGVEVIGKFGATGATAMPIGDIVSHINSKSGLTLTSAENVGGNLRLYRSDGGPILTQGGWVSTDPVGQEIYSVANGKPPYMMLLSGALGSSSGGSGGISGLELFDEGVSIGVYTEVNFIGGDVLADPSGNPNRANVYIPAPNFASHFNTTDGTTNGNVSESISRFNVRISTPTSEASPYFKTNGWAGSTHPSTTTGTVTFSTGGQVTGLSATGGDSNIEVNVYDADGVSLLATYTTPTLSSNATHTSSGANAGIGVTVSSFALDTIKWKGAISVSVNMDTIFTTNVLDGGRYNIEVIHTTDTATDGGSTYTYTQPDVFYDTNNSTPSINGAMTLIESTTPANILTKHISGVEYYVLNSEFETTTSDIDDLNENTQGRANTAGYNFRIIAPEYGLPDRNQTAWSLTHGTWNGTWTNLWDLQNADFEYLDWPITDSNHRYRGAAANGTSTVYDPWATGNSVNSPNASVLVDTFNDNSTRLGEDFDGETERLIRGATGYISWDSTATLGTGITATGTATPFCDACVVGSYLVRPDQFFLTDPNTNTVQANLTTYKPNKNGANPNYSGASYQDTAVYHRRFYTTGGNLGQAISSFTMTFSGKYPGYDDFSDALETSNLKVYVRRIAQPSGQTTASVGFNANPLSLHGALYNSGAPGSPFDDGASGVDTVGALIRTSNGGNSIPATFGGLNAEEGFWAEIQIVDPDIEIDYINVTLNFSSGGTDSNPVS